MDRDVVGGVRLRFRRAPELSLRLFAIAILTLSAGQGVHGQQPGGKTYCHQQPGEIAQKCVCQLAPAVLGRVITTNKDPADQPDQHRGASPGYFRVLLGPTNIANVLLVLVGFGAGLVAYLTLKAIARQADLLERQIASGEASSQQQLRAYVHIASAFVKIPSPGMPEAHVYFKNVGQTPAYDVHGWIAGLVADHPLQGDLPRLPEGIRQAHETLAPGRDYIFVYNTETPMPGLLRERLGKPEATWYIFGEITYKDVFGKDHFTKYRLIYGGPEGPRRIIRDGEERWVISHDSEGNEAS